MMSDKQSKKLSLGLEWLILDPQRKGHKSELSYLGLKLYRAVHYDMRQIRQFQMESQRTSRVRTYEYDDGSVFTTLTGLFVGPARNVLVQFATKEVELLIDELDRAVEKVVDSYEDLHEECHDLFWDRVEYDAKERPIFLPRAKSIKVNNRGEHEAPYGADMVVDQVHHARAFSLALSSLLRK